MKPIFITLTDRNDDQVLLVNISHVAEFAEDGDQALVCYADDSEREVKESIAEIGKAIDEATK